MLREPSVGAAVVGAAVGASVVGAAVGAEVVGAGVGGIAGPGPGGRIIKRRSSSSGREIPGYNRVVLDRHVHCRRKSDAKWKKPARGLGVVGRVLIWSRT